MCKGMNRSFLNVIAGGFGVSEGTRTSITTQNENINSTNHLETCSSLLEAQKIIIVPGYGMAVAQAQHIVQELTNKLRENGKKVDFAIHPVAGRLPGHMNVLLAEANLPYDIVFEMEEINPEFEKSNLVLVIGANDIVNPGALDDTTSPIYGMPVLEVWKSQKVIIFKRSMASGFSGVQNELFFLDKTNMLFGDAKDSIEGMVKEVREID